MGKEYGQLYFLRDDVKEDVTSIGIGEVWTYFYKETLIGVRDVRNGVSYFAKFPINADPNVIWAPTLKEIKAEHLKAAITEMDQTKEKCRRISINELHIKAKELVRNEINL